MLHFTVSVAVSCANAAVKVMALAPAVSVVFVGGFTNETVIAFTVRLSEVDFEGVETEVAVMVAVQSAFKEAAGCGV